MTLREIGRRTGEWMFPPRMTMADLRRAADAIDVPMPSGCQPPRVSTDDRLDALARDIVELRAGIGEIRSGVRELRRVPDVRSGEPVRYATGPSAHNWMRVNCG